MAPSLLFLATLVLMLFHPPDFNFHSLDRVAFGLLIFVVLLRVCVLRDAIHFRGLVTFPMLALVLLAFFGACSQPSDAEIWSLFAAKWLVPFTLYHLAAYIFNEERSLLRFETLLTDCAGIPQPDCCIFYGRCEAVNFPPLYSGRKFGISCRPRTRAISPGCGKRRYLKSARFDCLERIPAQAIARRAGPSVSCCIATGNRGYQDSRRVALFCLINSRSAFLFSKSTIAAGLLVVRYRRHHRTRCVRYFADHNNSLGDRLEERGPVMFRMAVYQAGWEMFVQKPLTGWGAADMQTELSKRISDFHQDQFFFHNTYLEIVVQYGLVGLLLYLWVLVDLFKLGRKQNWDSLRSDSDFLDPQFRQLWPVLLGVYFLNGSFVVMNYQFVNGFMFTVAGLLLAQNRRLEAAESSPSGR